MPVQYAKAPLEPMQFCRNGKYPDAAIQAEASALANHLALYRLKEVARLGCLQYAAVGSSGADAERVRWRFAFQSSPYASCIIAKAWLAQTESGATADPYARLRIQDVTPTTLGDAEFHFGAGPTEENGPNFFSHGTTFLMDSGAIAVPTPNTTYFGTVSDFNRARIIAISVYEGTLNTPAPFAEGHAVLSNVLDVDRGGIAAAARSMWKSQAAHLFNWTINVPADARTRTSATPINAVDDSSTSVSAATPGYVLDLRNRTTVRRGTVPVVFYAYGSSAGTGGTVTLRDSGGAAVATITNITTAGWYSTTANLPATLAKYDLWYAGDGTNVFTFSHASAFQWASGS